MLTVEGEALTFVFLGRAERMRRGAVDWSAGPPGAAGQLWRMNLHYMDYSEEVDDSLLEELILAWIDANPPSRPGSWRDSWSSYAVSLRAVVWMQQLAARAGRLDEAFVATASTSLARQLSFLEADLETDLGGNHLLENIRALLWGSAFFRGTRAERWREKGLRLLFAELPRQILADGVHYERSPSYHCRIFVDLLEIRSALGETLGCLDPMLRAMAQAVADLSHPDGKVCLFNDSGLDMAYSPAQCLSACEALFGEAPRPRAVFSFPDAGYFGARISESYLVADFGPIAPDDLPAHGHADVGSFEWSVAGRRIVVDQGVYEYVDGERRRRSRAASSHNTLCFARADQADFFGAFRCGRRPRVELRSYEARADGFSVEGAHDGFRDLPGAPRHVRRFDVTGDGLVIRDRIEGETDRPAAIRFLLHPDVAATIEGRAARLACGDARIAVESTLPISCEDAAYWPDMGREQATRRLKIVMPMGVSEATIAFRIMRAGGG
jgi:uncharacterized heparinase superfamily protein